MTIGQKMRKIRKAKGIGKKDMAKLMGVCEKTYYNWEHDEYPVAILQLSHWLDATETTFEELMKGE